MSRIRNTLVLLSIGILSITPAMAQGPKPPPPNSGSPRPPPFRPPGGPVSSPSPRPPPFRPPPAGPVTSPSPKPPPFQLKPPPGPPVTGVVPVNPGNGAVVTPDDEQRRRRMFFILMLRQQALTQAALQQAALASAFANQAPFQSAEPSYSSSYSSAYPTPMAPAVREQPPAAEPGLLAGIVDAEGKVAWPLGLQIVRPALETKTVRERLDGLVRVAAKQAAYGQVQRGILAEAKQLLAELRKAFESSRQDMPERTARDAEAFLTRLDSSLQSMQGGAMQVGERPAVYDDAGKKKY